MSNQKNSKKTNTKTKKEIKKEDETKEKNEEVEKTSFAIKIFRGVMVIALILAVVLMAGFALVYTGIVRFSANGPESILLNASNIGVKKGESYQYDYQVYPETSASKNVYYESSDPSIAEVNPTTGYITPKKEGSVVISVKSTNDDTVIEKSNLSVTKDKVAINDIKISSERIVFDLSNKSKSQLIKVFTEPYNATNQDLSFESSDESVAIVDQSGRVYPIGYGIAIISVRAKDGNANANCEVIVTDSKNKLVYFNAPNGKKIIFPYSIQLDTNYLRLRYGTSRKVGFELLPPDVTEDVVTWISSDPNVATVNDGVIYGNAIGTTTITARTVNDLAATVTVDVTDEEVTSSYVEFQDDTQKIGVGETKKLAVSYEPNATISNFIWSSSNPDIIRVDSEGNITALAKGSAIITVKPNSNSSGVQDMNASQIASKNGDSIVIIADGIETPNYLTVTETNITIGTGETRKLEVESDTGNDKFIYQSMNEEVAIVNKDGVIHGIKVGETEIKISAANGVSTNVKVNVINVEASKINISGSKSIIKKGDSLDLQAEVWPKNATEKTILWTSSNPNVATVNEAGVVFAKAVGQTTITASVGSQSSSIVLKVANEETSSEEAKPTNVLSDIEIEALKKTPIIFERVGEKKVKITLDLENQGFTDYVNLSKTTFSIVKKSVDETVKDLKINDIDKMPLSKNLTFTKGSYGKITVKASVYLKGNKKTVEIENATYDIGQDISVEFNVPIEARLSLASYFTVSEAANVTDWVITDPSIAKISDGYIEGMKVGSTYITGHSKGYTFTGRVNVIDDTKEETSNQNFTFLYDTCYSASDLCSVGTLVSTTLVKDTKNKCTVEKPYYVAKQKTKYEFVCKADKKKTTYQGASTYATIDKELTFDWANGASASKGETITIKIKNWDKLSLVNATVVNSLDNSSVTYKKADFKVTIPTKTDAKSVTLTVDAKTSGNNPKVYRGIIVINISDAFIPGSIECETANKLNIVAGKDKTLSCSLIGKYDTSLKEQMTSNDNPTYKSSDEKIVTVDASGKVTALKAGDATITVKAKDLKAKIKVTVEKAPPVYKILTVTLKKGKNKTTTIALGDQNLTLNYNLATSNGKTHATSGLNVVYASSDTNILTINGNIVTPVAAGKATITATYINDDASEVKGTLDITVTEKTPKIESLNCGPTMSLMKGDNGYAVDCYAYDSANNKNLGVLDKIFTYTVDDSNIVSVNPENGIVSALKVGTTKINVKAKGYSKTAIINVTVRSNKRIYESVKLTNLDNVELKALDEYVLTYDLIISNTEKDTTSPNVKITSSDPKVISVDGNKLKALKQGTAKITLSYTNPGAKTPLTDKKTVTVYELMPVCYRYKKISEGDWETCKEGYGYNGSDTKNCYKILSDITTKASCLQKSQRKWKNNQCLDLNDRYANQKEKIVASEYTFTAKESKTIGHQFDINVDKLEYVCRNSCNQVGCTIVK